MLVLTLLRALYIAKQIHMKNIKSVIVSTIPMIKSITPKILQILVAFFSLNFEIIFSVGKGKRKTVIPKISKAKAIIVIPITFTRENIKSPIGIAKTQTLLITENSLVYFS